MLTLYYAPHTCSLASHIALEDAGAVYELRRISFKTTEQQSAEYLKVNPKARVPALVTPRGVLTETPAMLAFIAQSFPDAGLAPLDDPFAFAQMQMFNLFIANNLHVAFRQIAFPDSYADGDAAAAALKAKAPELADRYFAVIEAGLADGRPYVHGDRFTLSDIYLFVYANYLRLGDRGDPARVPHVVAHRRRIRPRPAVQRILEIEGLADAWPD